MSCSTDPSLDQYSRSQHRTLSGEIIKYWPHEIRGFSNPSLGWLLFIARSVTNNNRPFMGNWNWLVRTCFLQQSHCSEQALEIRRLQLYTKRLETWAVFHLSTFKASEHGVRTVQERAIIQTEMREVGGRSSGRYDFASLQLGLGEGEWTLTQPFPIFALLDICWAKIS